MSLSFDIRRVGDVSVVRCSGRLIEGTESAALLQIVEDALLVSKRVVLQLGEIQYIDSGGLGLLVRVVTKTQTAGGQIKLCAVAPKVAEVIRVTRLESVFAMYATEEDAIAAFFEPPKSPGGSFSFAVANILCVARSADVLSYTGEVLRQAGYALFTVDNVTDALTLLKVTRPKLVITTREFRGNRGTPDAEAFNRLLDTTTVVELSPEFSKADAGAAARALLDRVRATVGGADTAAAPAGRPPA